MNRVFIAVLLAFISFSGFSQTPQIMDGFKKDVAERAKNAADNAFSATGRLHCVRNDNGQREGTEINHTTSGPTCVAARNAVMNYFQQTDRCAQGNTYKRAGQLQWLGCQ